MSNTLRPYQVAEIFDIIIDHLHNDKRALATCSLVCKAWLPSSRYHLFFAVQIFDTRNMTRFLLDLDSPLSTIDPFIRSLTLRECDYLQRFWVLDVFHAAPTSGIDHRTISLSRLTGLRMLKLKYFHFNHFGELVDLICSFRSLKEISLDSVDWGEGSTVVHQRPPRSLQVLRLGDINKESIFSWILSAGSHLLSSMKIVDLHHINPSQMPSLRLFLRAVGPFLKHLHLSFFNFDWTKRSPGESIL
jgi:hypothetical protein